MKLKYLTFLCFYLIFSTSIFSQIVNEGTLKIKAATLVYFGDEYTNKSTGTHDNDGELYFNNNFINEGATIVPISGTTYFKSTVNAIQTISGATNSVNFYNLEVDNTLSGVSVVDAFELNVFNSVALTNGDLRLVGEAQLVQKHTGASVNTSVNGKLLRDQQGISTTTGYNYWSSPVNNGVTFSFNGGLFDGTDASINSFSPQQVAFNSGSPYDGVAATVDGSGNVTTPLAISTQWLYTYSPNNAGYAGWDKIDKDSPISPGEGFTMKGTGVTNQNYVFKGTPNNGDYSFSIALGESALLGNPYPSALDISLFIGQNNSTNQIEIWIDGGTGSHYLASYLGGYATVTASAGVLPATPLSAIAGLGDFAGLPLPTIYLPVAQGFFVEAISSDPIVFNNSQRTFKTEVSGDSFFFKASKLKSENTTQDFDLKSIIRIGYEDTKGFHRQLALAFMPNSVANLNYNRGYDGFMTEPREDELFYIIENDLTKKYVIQGVGAFDDTYEFPLGLIIEEEGVHTIMLDAVENFNETVYIKDVVLDTIYNLSASNFKPNLPTGEYLNRFKLVFKDKDQIIVDDTEVDPNIKAYYNENKSIIIKNQSQIKLYNVFIYNMLGQKLAAANTTLLSATEISIPFDYKKGMYLVLIETEQGKKTYKIVN